MYIVLSKTTTQTAVIRDATELAGYLNTTPSKVRRNTKKYNRWEFKDYIIIIANGPPIICFVNVKNCIFLTITCVLSVFFRF